MNNQKILAQHAIYKGLALGATLIVFELIALFLGIITQDFMQFINTAIAVTMVIIAIRHYRDRMNYGLLRFGEGFQIGLFIFLTAGIVFAVFRYIELTLVTDLGPSLQSQAERNLDTSSMSEEQLEFWNLTLKMAFTPGIRAFSTLFGMVFWGSILSLILARLYKRDANPMINNSNQ
jgi:hypothetical protein